jgi:hypothetical protein
MNRKLASRPGLASAPEIPGGAVALAAPELRLHNRWAAASAAASPGGDTQMIPLLLAILQGPPTRPTPEHAVHANGAALAPAGDGAHVVLRVDSAHG